MTPPTYAQIRAERVRGDGEESIFAHRIRAITDPFSPSFHLDIDPDYQRGRVWTLAQSAAFVGHKMEGGESPTLIFQRWPSHSGRPDEVVDGKQRLLAMRGFIDGTVPAMLSDGGTYYRREWSDSDQHRLSHDLGLILRARYVSCPTRADVLRLYIRLNRGGSVHTDDEISRVRALLAKEPTP